MEFKFKLRVDCYETKGDESMLNSLSRARDLREIAFAPWGIKTTHVYQQPSDDAIA